MTTALRRPKCAFTPGHGLLRNDHFQMAYVTNDLDRTAAVFKNRYGIREYRTIEGQLPAGGEIRVELAWVGGIMFELIQARGPGTAFYNQRLPSDGFAIRHHHLGYLIQDETAWKALEREIESDSWTVAFRAGVAGFLHAVYVDAPELGHYLEYIYLEAEGVAFFEAVPST